MGHLAEAAVCRSQADWLVGMNATRAYTTKYFKKLTVGRVQTPTLAMLVERAGQISNFQKEKYFNVELDCDGIPAVKPKIFDPADPEQKTETENKDNNSDPDNEEKKEQNAPANGELNASAGEGQEPKAEDEGQPKLKTEAKASAEATASASDDASNGPRKASAYEDRMGEDSHDYGYNSGLGAGIVQIINNTAKKIKVSLSNAHIDLPTAADTSARGQAAIDVQGTGNVELKFSGSNTLTGSGQSAGIQKNDKEQNGKENTGTLTITADSQSDTLDVKVDKNALGQDYQGAAIGGHGKKSLEDTPAMARRTL